MQDSKTQIGMLCYQRQNNSFTRFHLKTQIAKLCYKHWASRYAGFNLVLQKKTASTGNEHIIPSLIKVSLLTAESECQDSKKWRKCDANYVFSRSTAYLGGKFISEINF